jgi:hypothetical protein
VGPDELSSLPSSADVSSEENKPAAADTCHTEPSNAGVSSQSVSEPSRKLAESTTDDASSSQHSSTTSNDSADATTSTEDTLGTQHSGMSSTSALEPQDAGTTGSSAAAHGDETGTEVHESVNGVTNEQPVAATDAPVDAKDRCKGVSDGGFVGSNDIDTPVSSKSATLEEAHTQKHDSDSKAADASSEAESTATCTSGQADVDAQSCQNNNALPLGTEHTATSSDTRAQQLEPSQSVGDDKASDAAKTATEQGDADRQSSNETEQQHQQQQPDLQTEDTQKDTLGETPHIC